MLWCYHVLMAYKNPESEEAAAAAVAAFDQPLAVAERTLGRNDRLLAQIGRAIPDNLDEAWDQLRELQENVDGMRGECAALFRRMPPIEELRLSLPQRVSAAAAAAAAAQSKDGTTEGRD